MVGSGIIYCPFVIFILMFALHVLVWRIKTPGKQILSLFLIFIFFPYFLFLIIYCIYRFLGYGPSFEDTILMLLLYSGLAGVYIQTYPSIQACSPTLMIVYMIGRNKKPYNTAEIKEMIKSEDFLEERLEDLKAEKLIRYTESKDSITITQRGSILSGIFILYRRFLGLEEGKG